MIHTSMSYLQIQFFFFTKLRIQQMHLPVFPAYNIKHVPLYLDPSTFMEYTKFNGRLNVKTYLHNANRISGTVSNYKNTTIRNIKTFFDKNHSSDSMLQPSIHSFFLFFFFSFHPIVMQQELSYTCNEYESVYFLS